VRTIIKKISIRSIDAKRFVKGAEALNNLKITNSSGVTSVGRDNDMLVVGFVYSVDYYPNIASIKVEGDVYYMGPDAYQVTSKSPKLPPAAAKEVQTAIMRFCLPELVIVAKQLELIPPIPMPSMDAQRANGSQVKDNAYDYR